MMLKLVVPVGDTKNDADYVYGGHIYRCLLTSYAYVISRVLPSLDKCSDTKTSTRKYHII